MAKRHFFLFLSSFYFILFCFQLYFYSCSHFFLHLSLDKLQVGMVLVPQSMSYAKLAGLKPEFGLYSSFIGVLTYAFFATSKDVSIGPVAVMSLQTGRIVADGERLLSLPWLIS